jgi:hypothetical protein
MTRGTSEAIQSTIKTNVAFVAILGAVVLLNPTLILRGFGIFEPSFAVLGVVRMYSVMAIVLGTLLWSSRTWLASPAGRATRRAMAIAYGIAAILLTTQQWTVWYGRTGVALTFGCIILAFGYWTAREPRAAAAPA